MLRCAQKLQNYRLTHPHWCFPCGVSGKESTCQSRRSKRRVFDPWVGKNLRSGKWQSTPVFLSGEFHGQRSLEGCSPWGRKELDTTEQLTLAYFFHFHLLSFNSSFSHFCFLYYGFPQASQNFCKITIILYSMLSKKLKSVTHTCFVRGQRSQLPESVEKESQPGPPKASWAAWQSRGTKGDWEHQGGGGVP